jgi:hypothetical protein
MKAKRGDTKRVRRRKKEIIRRVAFTHQAKMHPTFDIFTTAGGHARYVEDG